MNEATTVEQTLSMPTTRYQGSKRKVLPRLRLTFDRLEFGSALDAFGGTGAVSHLLTAMGKDVCYNDILHSNCAIATALFADCPVLLEEKDVDALFEPREDIPYADHIARLYDGIYYTDVENRQLDTLVQNIHLCASHEGRDEAFYALFQAMLSKRPYNLFHRANLEMRTSEVRRSFGNKTTWDRPFTEHMKRFLRELTAYRARSGKRRVRVRRGSAFDCPTEYDLVYLDPPYAKSVRSQESNYFNFYHFLDAMVRYHEIPALIRSAEKHRPIYPPGKSWHSYPQLTAAFEALVDRFSGSHLVISYRDDGYPSVEQIVEIVGGRYRHVEVFEIAEYRYALADRRRESREVAIIGTNCPGRRK